MSSYITTSSKIHFTPVSPDPEQIVIRDIAHALSLMTRANGHFPDDPRAIPRLPGSAAPAAAA